jgi:hypothetical protein
MLTAATVPLTSNVPQGDGIANSGVFQVGGGC